MHLDLPTTKRRHHPVADEAGLAAAKLEQDGDGAVGEVVRELVDEGADDLQAGLAAVDRKARLARADLSGEALELLGGDVGEVRATTSSGSPMGSRRSPVSSTTRSSRPKRVRLRPAHASAAVDASVAKIFACGACRATASATAPLPVPASATRTRRRALGCARMAASVASTSVSVSGRGMRAPGPTSNVSP